MDDRRAWPSRLSIERRYLYPILHGMERQGYLKSTIVQKGGRNRRVYRITRVGRKALATARKRVDELFGEMFERH